LTVSADPAGKGPRTGRTACGTTWLAKPVSEDGSLNTSLAAQRMVSP